MSNLLLPTYNIVYFTWGNVSVYSPEQEVVAIKPSGVSYSLLKADDIVVLDINGKVIEGSLHPSSELHTHLEIYRNFTDVRSVVHTHSTIATPGILVKNHGPFAWGETSKKAVENAVTLEIVAKMNTITLSVNLQPSLVSKGLLHKHYYRKHGKDAYYGQ